MTAEPAGAAEQGGLTDEAKRNNVIRFAFDGDSERFEEFIKAALSGDLWESQSKSDKATLGTRVFQESYDNAWVSYLADARKQGMTGYQFRAPGEWVAELYGCWKLGKMKPSHPAVKWLEKFKI